MIKANRALLVEHATGWVGVAFGCGTNTTVSGGFMTLMETIRELKKLTGGKYKFKKLIDSNGYAVREYEIKEDDK